MQEKPEHENTGQDPDLAPEETLFEQAAELAALTGNDNGPGPADLAWAPQDDEHTP